MYGGLRCRPGRVDHIERQNLYRIWIQLLRCKVRRAFVRHTNNTLLQSQCYTNVGGRWDQTGDTQRQR